MAKLRDLLTGAALGVALALAGCAGGDDDGAAEDAATTATNGAEIEVPLEDATVEAIPETETPAPVAVEDAAPATNASVAAPPPDAPLAEEEQIIDDAEATGMTSRLPAEGGDTGAANEAQPAE